MKVKLMLKNPLVMPWNLAYRGHSFIGDCSLLPGMPLNLRVFYILQEERNSPPSISIENKI
jgi:hypothetical protein